MARKTIRSAPETAPRLGATAAGWLSGSPATWGERWAPEAVGDLAAPPASPWPPPFSAPAFQSRDPRGLSSAPDPQSCAQGASAAPPAEGTRGARRLGSRRELESWMEEEERREGRLPVGSLPGSRLTSPRHPSPRRPGQPAFRPTPAPRRQPAAPTLHSCCCTPCGLLPRAPLLGKQ